MSDGVDSYAAWAATQSAARPPATIGEIWSAEWDRAALDTGFGLVGLRRDVTDEAVKAAEAATGRGIDQLAADRGRTLDGADFATKKWIVQDLAAGGDDATKQALAPYADMDALMRRRAAEIERRGETASANAYGLSGWAVGVAAHRALQSVPTRRSA